MTLPVIDGTADVHRWLDDLEHSVVIAEGTLRRRAWRELGEAISQQRRFTHGLKNALELSPLMPTETRAEIDARIESILRRRATQIRRLELFHAQVGRRLRELTQFKFALRQMSLAQPHQAAIVLNTER